MKKMTYEVNEQRRNKEEAIRLREEALKYAESIKAENERLRQSLEQGEQTLVSQAKGRVQAELDRAKVAYKEAIDSGDSDLILEANDKVTALRIEADKIKAINPQRDLRLNLNLNINNRLQQFLKLIREQLSGVKEILGLRKILK